MQGGHQWQIHAALVTITAVPDATKYVIDFSPPETSL